MSRNPTNYIPRPDGDFSAWSNHYYDAVEAWWNEQGLAGDGLDALKNALLAWNAAYPAHVAAQQQAEGARAAKDDARRALEREIRPITNFVQTYPTTTDAERAEIGITVRDTARTAAPTPTTAPRVSVVPGGRLRHELRLADETTPTRRAKPEGVVGAEVWVKLLEQGTRHQASGTSPSEEGADLSGLVPSAQSLVPSSLGDPLTFSYLTMSTRSTVRTTFDTDAGGKTAVYMLRWVNTRGEKGPWSDIASATVAA